MGTLVGVLVLTLAVEGCTSSPPSNSASPTPSVGETNGVLDPWSTRPEFLDCTSYALTFQVSRSDMQSKLPPGYQAAGPLANELVPLSLELDACKSMVLSNRTVISPVSFLMTNTPTHVNATLAGNAQAQRYLFEFFVTNQTVHELFLRAGMPSILANVTLAGSAPNRGFTVGVKGSLWYEATILGGVAPSFEGSGVFRFHHLRVGGRAGWSDFNLTYTETGDEAPATLKVHEGFAKTLRPGDQGVMQGTSGPGTARGTISFGRL